MSYIYGKLGEAFPELVQYLVNKDDADKYYARSAVKVEWICPNCHKNVGKKAIAKVTSRGIPCPYCGDGVSKSEKIVASALEQSGVRFESEKTFEWAGKRRYDFFLPDQSSIIEVNGSQHYKLGFKNFSGVSLEDQVSIDAYKKDIALDNGIDHYFKINATDTSAKNIVPQFIDIMQVLGVECSVSCAKCEEAALKSRVVEASNLYKKGLWSGEISKKMGISVGCVIDYLKTGAEIGICDYDPLEAHRESQREAVKHLMRPVRCITTGKEFPSIRVASDAYDISTPSNIIRSIKNPNRHAGSFNGEPLAWEYIDDNNTKRKKKKRVFKNGDLINAEGAPIYSSAGYAKKKTQFFKDDPIYKVLDEENGYVLVRHHLLDDGYTGWFKISDIKLINR